MLVHSVARQTGLPFEQARAEVEKDVAEMRRSLSRQGQLSIGRIGILMSNDDLVEFFPSTIDGITPMASWLPVIQPVAAIERARDMRRHIEQAAERHIWHRRFATVARAAASIVILLAVCIAVSTPMAVDTADYASLYPEIGTTTISVPVKHKAQIEPQTKCNDVQTKASNSADVLTPVVAQSAITTAKSAKVGASSDVERKSETARKDNARGTISKEARRSYTEIRFRDSDPYCLIVASLPSAADAQKFIDDQYRVNPEMALAVLHKDGRYRVYAATGKNMAALQAQASDSRIARRYKGAWVCAR